MIFYPLFFGVLIVGANNGAGEIGNGVGVDRQIIFKSPAPLFGLIDFMGGNRENDSQKWLVIMK